MVATDQDNAMKLPSRQDRARPARVVPMSYAQQRLWMLDRMLPVGRVYNFTKVVRLKGALDVEALQRALNELVRRHEVLRTRFTMHNGEPMQVIEPELTLPLDLKDLTVLPEDHREAEAQRQIRDDSRMTFILDSGPLLRVRLLRLAKNEHWILRTVHHLVTDGWSMGIFWRELSALYGAFVRREPSPLQELAMQYADYAKWQRELLQGEDLQRQLEYWKRTLADCPVLGLPTDYPRPAIATYRGGRLTFAIGVELTRSLRAVSRQEGATLFTTLLAAFQVLLYRYTGQADIAVGVPVAGRRMAGTENLIGFFVNTLAIRGDLSGAPNFREYLGRVRARVSEAYAHQDVPFEKLVEELHLKRDLSRNPLFQVCFTKLFPESHELRLVGIETARVAATGNNTAKFDLDFALVEMDGQTDVAVEYAEDLFDRTTIERLVGHLLTLLEGVVADPDCSIDKLPLLTATERHQLVVEWNATAVDYPPDECVHQLFEQQVERSPDAAAVVLAEQQLTYRELNARANQLARHLRSLGVGPDVLVGLCVERSLDMVVGLLGILKAGGAYVPLDPSYPAARLAFMLQDAQAQVLLTQVRLLDRLPAHAGRTLCLDRDWPIIATQPATNATTAASATNLAYVIYTSGSTGTPKGVMIEHRSLVNHMHWMQRRFPLDASDSVLQKTPSSADAAVWEFFSPLLNGARLVMYDAGAYRVPLDLLHSVMQRGITVLQLLPSILAIMLDGPGFEGCKSLRRVYCGGEALPNELVRRFSKQCPAELVNLYGPTEVTIDATAWVCGKDDDSRLAPIGRPIDNTTAYVLGAAQEPVPIGVIGELSLGGHGVARGYWRRADLSAQRFVLNPFGSHPAARIYRTGDLARYRRDGTLEFVGRCDQQVKIRGYRVELGEIETSIAAHPKVSDAVVLADESRPGDRRLVAYVVLSAGADVKPIEMHTFLRSRLPDFMIPAATVFLETFPRLPNGKIDRDGLQSAGRESHTANAERYVKPRGPVEEQVAAIWADILGVERLGVYDDFFELGGHSLLAMRLLTRVEATFGMLVSVREFFDNPTIANLVQLLAQTRGHVDASDSVAPSAAIASATAIRRNPRVLAARRPGTGSAGNDQERKRG